MSIRTVTHTDFWCTHYIQTVISNSYHSLFLRGHLNPVAMVTANGSWAVFFCQSMCLTILTPLKILSTNFQYFLITASYLCCCEFQTPTRASCGRFWSIYSGSPGNPPWGLWQRPRPGPQTGWWRHGRDPANGRKWKKSETWNHNKEDAKH